MPVPCVDCCVQVRVLGPRGVDAQVQTGVTHHATANFCAKVVRAIPKAAVGESG